MFVCFKSPIDGGETVDGYSFLCATSCEPTPSMIRTGFSLEYGAIHIMYKMFDRNHTNDAPLSITFSLSLSFLYSNSLSIYLFSFSFLLSHNGIDFST